MLDIILEPLLAIDKDKIKKKLLKQIEALKQDILTNHLPKVSEGLQKDYIDENQALVVYDHLVRIRTYQDLLKEIK